MTEPAPGVEIARDAEWQRLDPRMLLVHPVKELMRFLPVVAADAVGVAVDLQGELRHAILLRLRPHRARRATGR